MSKYDNVNLEPLSSGVILAPIFVEESIITADNISKKASFDKKEKIWKGECEVVRVGPDVKELTPGERVYVNITSRNRIAFEHKGHELLWTVEPAIFARIKPDSGIIV